MTVVAHFGRDIFSLETNDSIATLETKVRDMKSSIRSKELLNCESDGT